MGGGRRTLYSPERHRAIVAAIRAGAYDWLAAEACGVDRRTFRRWMLWGKRRRKPWVTLYQDVREARAQARVAAEIEVRKEQPFNWLRFGPGREREDEPGWTESSELKLSGSVDLVHTDEWQRIASAIDEALKPFPQARIAVASALSNLNEPSDEP